MPTNATSAQAQKAVRLYFMGLACVMLGAILMDYFDSVAPMALCASAGLMLSTPLLTQLGRRYLGRPDHHAAD